jgi:hypothetical protein
VSTFEIPEDKRARPLKPEDFTLRYDADHTFYFFESEDGDAVYAYGHVDKKQFAKDVLEYWRFTSGQDFEDDELDERNVAHRHAVGVIPIDSDPEVDYDDLYFFYAPETAQHARPITVLCP